MNKCMLLGRICKDFDLKQTQSGMAYCGFSLAVNRRVKKDEESQADFLICKCFGKTAEFASKYFRKGSQIALTGRIQTGSYDNKEGQKVYTTEIMVEEVFFADSKKESQGDAYEGQSNSQSGFYPIDTSSDELPF